MIFSDSNTPYTYLIGWSKFDIYYYGRRTAIDCHPSELWVTYFTSSMYVAESRLLHGEPDIIQVRQQFYGDNRNERCASWEERVIDRIDAVRKPNWLNKSNRGEKFNTTGRANVKDKAGNTFSVSVDDPRYLSGELVGVAYNLSGSRESKPTTVDIPDGGGSNITVEINDPRYLSYLKIGKIVVRDHDGTPIQISTSDPRYTSRELKPIQYGMVNVRDDSGKTYSVPISDPRYVSGELKPTQTGMVNVRDKDDRTFSVSVNDPRYQSGELVPANKGRTYTPIRVECPHCRKTGAKNRMSAKHFEKCKSYIAI